MELHSRIDEQNEEAFNPAKTAGELVCECTTPGQKIATEDSC